ncbi:Serine protease H6, partial [Caligus rogercresseyi]
DEVVAVSEKSVLRVVDLLDWIAVPCEVVWDRGLSGVHHPDGSALSLGEHSLYPEFLEDVRQEKVSIGDTQSPEDLAVIILSLSQYARYRSVPQADLRCGEGLDLSLTGSCTWGIYGTHEKYIRSL